MAHIYYVLFVSWISPDLGFRGAREVKLKRLKKDFDQARFSNTFNSIFNIKNVLNTTGMTNHFHQASKSEVLVLDAAKVHTFGLEKNDKVATMQPSAPYSNLNFYNMVEYEKMQIFFPRDFYPMVYYKKTYAVQLSEKFMGKRKQTGFANTSLSAYRTKTKLYYLDCQHNLNSVNLARLLSVAKNQLKEKSFSPQKEASDVVDFVVCSKTSLVFIANATKIQLHKHTKKYQMAEKETCFAMAPVQSVLVAALAVPIGTTNCYHMKYVFLNQGTLRPIAPLLKKTVGAAFMLPQKITHASVNIGEVVISMANFGIIDLILLNKGHSCFIKKDLKIADVCLWTILAVKMGYGWKILIGSNNSIYECKIPLQIPL